MEEATKTEEPKIIPNDLCILCCCSFTPPDKANVGGGGGADGTESVKVGGNENLELFTKFCKELAQVHKKEGQRSPVQSHKPKVKVELVEGQSSTDVDDDRRSGEVADSIEGQDDEGEDILLHLTGGLRLKSSHERTEDDGGEEEQQQRQPPACPDCLKMMGDVITKRGTVDEKEEIVRKLQLELLVKTKELHSQLGEYFEEVRRMEEVVKNSDVSCLDSYLERTEGLSEGGKAAIVTFRNWILSASTDLQSFQNILKRKLLITSPEPPSSSSRLEKAIVGTHELRKRNKRKKVGAGPARFNPLDFLSLEVSNEMSGGTGADPAIKTETGDDYEDAGGEDMDIEAGDREYDLRQLNITQDNDDGDYQHSWDGSSSSSGTEDDAEDSDYCPSTEAQEEAILEQRHFLASMMIGQEGEGDPLQTSSSGMEPPPPKKKKKKKKWKKKRLTRDVSDQVKDLSEFKADIVKRVIKMQDRKERLRTKQLADGGSDAAKPADYLVEDPGQDYNIEYDFQTGKMTLGHVEILLDEESESLVCTACLHSTNKLADSSYRYKRSEKIIHLFYHILGKHLDAYKCAMCGAVLQTRCRYKDHIKGHQLQFTCDQCGKSLSSKGALHTHKWRLHMTEEDIQKALANGEIDPRIRQQRFKEKQASCNFTCDTCGKPFLTKMQLKTHQETHIDISQRKQFMCPQCGKSFTRGGWVSHQANSCRPEGAPILYCDQCPPGKGKGFASPALLKRHVDRVHGKHLSRLHQCQLCGKSFKTISDLKRHDISHSDLRPFICKHMCGASFKARKHCSRHEGTCKGDEGSWRGPRQTKTSTKTEQEEEEEQPKPQVILPNPLNMSHFQ